MSLVGRLSYGIWKTRIITFVLELELLFIDGFYKYILFPQICYHPPVRESFYIVIDNSSMEFCMV